MNKEKIEIMENFFLDDMFMKKSIIDIAPTEEDGYNEDYRVKYLERAFKKLENIIYTLSEIGENFEFEQEAKEAVVQKLIEIKQNFIQKGYSNTKNYNEVYISCFSDMSKELIEKTKKELFGYKLNKDFTGLIKECNSINELLHIIHQYIVNNEEILQLMPINDKKTIDNGETVTLYGKEDEDAGKLYNSFSNDSNVGITDIISLKSRIIMMVRDVGHALSIDIEKEKEKFIVRYFIPKICNMKIAEKMRGEKRYGKDLKTMNGIFETEDISEVVDFINTVPTDLDMDFHDFNYEIEAEKSSVDSGEINTVKPRIYDEDER